MHDLSGLKKRIEEVKIWLKNEFAAVRTGRATPAFLDSVKIESYGTTTPIAHVASVSIENARTLRITPWDKGQISTIETSLKKANLGVSVATDKDGLRVNFPELTSERRAALMKVVNEKLEQARVSVRTEREKVLADINKKEKDGEIAEDDKFRLKNEIQKIVDQANKDLESAAEKKEAELSA